MKTTQYLDAVKKKLAIESDYALAAHLGMTRFGVSKLRRGIVVMSNTTAARVARILEIPIARVIADLELERGSDPDLWKSIRNAAAWAAIAIGTASFGVMPQHARAAFELTPLVDPYGRPITPSHSKLAQEATRIHIASRRRRWLAALRSLGFLAALVLTLTGCASTSEQDRRAALWRSPSTTDDCATVRAYGYAGNVRPELATRCTR